MKKLFTILCLLTCMFCSAQGPSETPGTLPSIIPPSPEVASLVRVGGMSTSLHTGSANVNIPLYELTSGSIKMPISLQYSTNGTRTNDIPSRVGLGWNLVAGGSVSRIIHDEEDGGSLTIPLAPPSFSQPNQATLDYLFYANQEHYDTERDEYSFSVNGISGKFFFDAGGVPRIANHSNIKISFVNNAFTITGGDGMIYEFGKNLELEKTRDVKTNGNLRAHKVKTTSWFLTRIISPDGEQINFNYAPIYTKTQQGPYQSVILRTTQPGYPFPPNMTNCGGMCPGQWSSHQYNRVDYDTWYLSYITTSNGQQVNFIYQDRPDIGGDNRLMTVEVYSTNDASPIKPIKRYTFEYEDVPIANDLNQRFFLKKVNTVATDAGATETLTHKFDYNSPATLASQESLLQDYYGYSKGNGGQPANFFPLPSDYASYTDGFLGIDRSPDFEATKAGTLSKVTYPTGGTEEFIYEPHSINQGTLIVDSVFTTTTLEGPGQNYNSVVTYSHQFTSAAAPMRINLFTGWNMNGPAPGSINYWPPDGIHFISAVEIWNVSTNTKEHTIPHKDYQTTNHHIQLASVGVQYEIRLKVWGNSHRARAVVSYNPVVQQTTVYNDVNVCGIRVKQIVSFDPVTNKTTNKYFKYASLGSIDKSSGVGVLKPNFEFVYQGGGVCYLTPTVTGEPSQEVIFECPGGLKQVSSSSLSGGFTFNGSPIAYAFVIEGDDPSFANGGIEHKFSTSFYSQQPQVLLGTAVSGATSSGPTPDLNGTELRTTVFKTVGGAFIPLKQTENVYGYDNNNIHTLSSYVTRKRWDPPGQSNWTYDDKVKGYDVSTYLYMSQWSRLDYTTTTEYDENGINPKVQTVNYTYANNTHLQPTQVTTSNSKNESIVQQMKYPVDFTGAVYTGMVTKNIITPVIETSTTNNGSLVSLVKTDYDTWSGTLYKPSAVKIQNGTGTLQPRVVYYGYDSEGNPLELSKDNGEHISYIWNYQKTYPVAEVKNAAYADIAYTSFEGDFDGGWTVSGVKQTVAMTGEKSLNGLLSRAVNSSKSYIVTLWGKDTHTPTVNNTNGELLATNNGWKLYRWKITGVSSVQVDGSYVDEVRLYPLGAQMTTYTFTPFVGITTSCDANNTIKYYSYDRYNRLSLVKDVDRNIIKKICYTYTGKAEFCEPGLYYNTEQSAVFTRQCSPGYAGSQVTYVVAANSYSSSVSVAAANQLAQNDIATNGQAYANANGTCVLVCGTCTGNDKKCINGVCETGTWVVVDSYKVGNTWYCTYGYCFSDGSHSSFTQTVTSSSFCPISCF